MEKDKKCMYSWTSFCNSRKECHCNKFITNEDFIAEILKRKKELEQIEENNLTMKSFFEYVKVKYFHLFSGEMLKETMLFIFDRLLKNSKPYHNIGDVFTVDGVEYVVVDDDCNAIEKCEVCNNVCGCAKCALGSHNRSANTTKYCRERDVLYFGHCEGNKRKDKKNIIFMKNIKGG